jgi:hypothetical protein
VNYATKKLISTLAIGLVPIALSVMPTSALAQNPQRRVDITPQAEIRVPQAEVRAETVQAQINPALIKLNRRAPIQFRAFEILDPTNRKPISRDTMLPELPNGKRLTAGQYYDELNKLEQQFNALGYTLKTPGGAKFELQTTAVPVANLQRQAQLLRTAHLPNLQFKPLNLPDLDTKHKAWTFVHPNLGNLTLAPTAKTVHWAKDWNYSLGDPSVFSAYINGKIELNGTKDLTKVDGEASAGGSMFSHSFDLLRVTGNLNAPKSGTMNVKVGVSVLGISVYSLDHNAPAAWSKSDSLSKTLDKSVTIHFALGPIPMSAKIGAQGTAGIAYAVALAPVKASAYVGPFVHTKVYAQVGVDIVVAGAGAGANLTLLNTDGNLNGSLSIEIDSASKPYFKWTDSYCQSLDMLAGNVYIYAYIYVPCWALPPWCKEEHDWNIFSWSGFHVSGCLFNDSRTLYLY